MIFFLLVTFLMLAASMIVWGIARPARYYQFPTLTGAVWLLYLGPMAVGIYNNRIWLPDGVERDGGIEMTLLMGILCIVFGYLGYLSVKPDNKTHQENTEYSNDRIFICSIIFLFIGYLAFFKLASLSGGVYTFFSVDGSYKLEWTGLPVAYDFFVKLVYPGLILCLFSFLDKQTLLRFWVLILGMSMPLANIILRGRRSELAAVLIILAFSLFLRKRWAPPKIVIVAFLFLGAFAVLAAPVYRAHSQLGGEKSEIWNISAEKLFTSLLSGNEYTELHYAVVQLPATFQENEYNYGRGFYNRIIQQWVPKILTGEQLKQNLFWPGPDFKRHTLDYYGWTPQNGWIPTVIVDLFREFSFFGALLFFIFGRFYRHLWEHARKGDIGSQIFYIALAPSAMYAIVSGLTAFVAQLLYLLVFLLPVIWFCKEPAKVHTTAYA